MFPLFMDPGGDPPPPRVDIILGFSIKPYTSEAGSEQALLQALSRQGFTGVWGFGSPCGGADALRGCMKTLNPKTPATCGLQARMPTARVSAAVRHAERGRPCAQGDQPQPEMGRAGRADRVADLVHAEGQGRSPLNPKILWRPYSHSSAVAQDQRFQRQLLD